MNNEDKELLLTDLCGRLAYGVKGIISYDRNKTLFTVKGFSNNNLCLSNLDGCHIDDFKPYLRPMSSMTEDEWRTMHNCCNAILMGDKRICIQKSKFGSFSELQDAYTTIDWLNAHHFDYRGLIEKGLALEAPEV